MTCEEFLAALQHQIDTRQSLESSELLQTHASHCQSCRERLVAWQQIASVIRSSDPAAESLLADADSGMRRSESYPGTLGPRVASLRAKAAIAVAIAAVLVIAFRWPQTPPTPPTGVSSIASRDAGSSASSLPLESMTSNDRLSILAAENVLAHENFGGENPAYGMRTNPVAWFHDVQQRDWLGQTIPTVESFRDGVAPIGRSLLRAVTILTTSGKDQPS